MNFDLQSLLGALPIIGPFAKAAPAVKSLIDAAIGTLHQNDQPAAKAALADLMAENKEGHERLQQKLADAAKRT